MEKRKITLITISVLSFILMSFLFAANKIEMENNTEAFSKKDAECECDSIKSLYEKNQRMLIEIGIENCRYEIILKRLWEKDTAIYNEMTKDLE